MNLNYPQNPSLYRQQKLKLRRPPVQITFRALSHRSTIEYRRALPIAFPLRTCVPSLTAKPTDHLGKAIESLCRTQCEYLRKTLGK